MDLPLLPRTPDSALGPTIFQSVAIGGHAFRLARPDAVDRLLGPDGEYLPFWAHLWPASRVLAEAVLAEPISQGTRVLEIGCGLGLPGLAALARGGRVLFTDMDATALRYVGESARENGLADFELLAMNWRDPPAGQRWPLILASDPIYEAAQALPLARFLIHGLEPGGTCLLAEQNRLQARGLLDELAAAGLAVQSASRSARDEEGSMIACTLHRIVRPS